MRPPRMSLTGPPEKRVAAVFGRLDDPRVATGTEGDGDGPLMPLLRSMATARATTPGYCL